MSKKKGANVPAVLIVIMCVFVATAIVVAINQTSRLGNQLKAAEQFGIELEGAGLTVLEGIIQSPSVIIVVDSPVEFMEIVEEHYQDAIYYYPKSGYTPTGFRADRAFYVFNHDMTIAWKYTPK